MSLEHFPWLTDAVLTHKNLTFPSSIIIEGEAGLAKKELANFFAPESTLIPGMEPEFFINSGIVLPEELFSLFVSS